MAHFRSTAFDPVDVQQLKANDGALDFQTMEKDLAREMARMKIGDNDSDNYSDEDFYSDDNFE